ncbi:MAG: hypothetical protein H6945_13490 [Zoogloeaceae bacterium]|nr:hypothetical protein [Zoogloeaceae bacterium]
MIAEVILEDLRESSNDDQGVSTLLASGKIPSSAGAELAGIVAGLAEFAAFAMWRDPDLAQLWFRTRGPR